MRIVRGKAFITIPLITAMLAATGMAQQSGLSASPAPSVSASSAMQQLQASDNPLLGSVPQGKANPNPINLTILDAIDRGLKYNLGILLSQQGNNSAAAARVRALSRLLPNVEGRAAESVQQINLAAYGFPVQPGQSAIIGPFAVTDVRAAATQNILDFTAINNLRSATANVDAAKFSYQNAQELVVLVVGSTYLQTLADQARVEAAKAELATAEAVFKQASDMKNAGIVPGIDVLRAQVQMQAQQQRLLALQNLFDKDLLQVARVIGLPSGQQFNLTDKIPAPAPLELQFDEALQRAYGRRPDYLQAQAQLKAAEASKAAAEAERLPTIGFQGDYGVIGKNLGNSHGTFTAAAALKIPIFEGGRIKADVQQADSVVNQRRAQFEDLRGKIEYEVRSAYLDYESANKQLQVATSALELARQQLGQARDRFAAGVTNNIEVVQSQEAEATAQENYISSLFAHNFSKLALARALGVAEDATKRFLGGK